MSKAKEYPKLNLALRGDILADREFVYTLMIALSELHSRHCEFIGRCSDMEESTACASCLEDIAKVYNTVEGIAASMDDRPPNLLEI